MLRVRRGRNRRSAGCHLLSARAKIPSSPGAPPTRRATKKNPERTASTRVALRKVRRPNKAVNKATDAGSRYRGFSRSRRIFLDQVRAGTSIPVPGPATIVLPWQTACVLVFPSFGGNTTSLGCNASIFGRPHQIHRSEPASSACCVIPLHARHRAGDDSSRQGSLSRIGDSDWQETPRVRELHDLLRLG